MRGRGVVTSALLMLGCGAPPAATPPLSTGAPEQAAPAEPPSRAGDWRLPLPQDVRVMGRVDLGVLINHQASALANAEALAGCGIEPSALSGDVEFAVASPGKILAKLYAPLKLTQAACLLGVAPPSGGHLALAGFDVTEPAEGGLEFRNFPEEPLAKSSTLLESLKPLLGKFDVAIVASVGPNTTPIRVEAFGNKPRGNEQRGTLRLVFPEPQQAERAHHWLSSRLAAAQKQAPELGQFQTNVNDEALDLQLVMNAQTAHGLRAHVLEPFKIPSSGMHPTLLLGDQVVVDKGGRESVQRGDLVIFTPPKDAGAPLLKRVVGVAGDRVGIHQGNLTLNGKALPVAEKPMGPSEASSWLETLNGHEYATLRADLEDVSDTPVPDGHLFVMGDNRGNSHDSRAFGAIPESSVLGKVSFIYFSSEEVDGKVNIRWERIGQVVD